MSANVHHLKRRPDPVTARAMEMTDPQATALNDMGQLFKAAAWLAARGYQILGTRTGQGRLHLSDGHMLRQHDHGTGILIQPKPGIFADLGAETVGRYTCNNGITRLVMRASNPAWPRVSIYWTSEDHPKCAA